MRSLVLRGTMLATIAVGVILAVLGVIACNVSGADQPDLGQTLIWFVPTACMIVCPAIYFVMRTVFKPVHELADSASALTAGKFGQRLSVADGDAPEVVALAETINQLLTQMETSLDQAKRFSSDAAHELKTPLTILLGHLQAACAEAEEGSESEERLTMLVDEIQRLRELVNGLLFLARADSGLQLPPDKPIDFSKLLGDMCEDLEVIAEGLEVTAEVAPNLQVLGTASLLQQAVQNLISNAIKYNRKEGWIRVSVVEGSGTVFCRVANAGKGISEKDQPHVFDRFFRVDESRSRIIDGHGLGLSLAREIVRNHQGDLTLAKADPDNTVFQISLPAVKA